MYMPSLVTIHIGVVIITLMVVLYADKQGWAWLRGRQEFLDATLLKRLHLLVWCGLAGLIATGLLLFWPLQAYLLYLPAFYVKMSFVLALLINSFVIGKLMYIATRRTYASLSRSERQPLLISGVISTLSWVGAIVAALLLGV